MRKKRTNKRKTKRIPPSNTPPPIHGDGTGHIPPPSPWHDDGDEDDEDRPIRRVLKVVTVLDCTAGHADEAGVGEPIGILTIEHNEEIEQSMMLRLRDMRVLLRRLEDVLTLHGQSRFDPEFDHDS